MSSLEDEHRRLRDEEGFARVRDDLYVRIVDRLSYIEDDGVERLVACDAEDLIEALDAATHAAEVAYPKGAPS